MQGYLVYALAVLAVLSGVSAFPIKCGDTISIRSADSWRYLTVPEHGEVLADSPSVTVREALVLECKDKPKNFNVETGDTVAFKVFRSKKGVIKYLHEIEDKEGISLVPAREKTYFYIEDPQNLQSRINVQSGTAKIAIRPVDGTNNFLDLESDGKLIANSIRAHKAKNQYTITKAAQDFTKRCPVDAKGKPCSGQGVCESNYCVCNRQYAGEYCEFRREIATCKAVGDPHWSTFDGMAHNMYETGEFLQYAEPNSPYHEAVSSFLIPWNHASVTAGVTVKRDNEDGTPDYITIWGHGRNQVTINCDKDKKGNVINYSSAISNLGRRGLTLESGLNIRQERGWWIVHSPSYMTVRYRGFSLYITVEEPRRGTARGLCGNNDKRRSNDLSKRWRWNEPVRSITDKLRIEDGKTYDYKKSRNGVPNGKPSNAFYQCKGDSTFFNFIDIVGVTNGGQEDEEIKPDISLTSTSEDASASVTLLSDKSLLEEALASETCKTSAKKRLGARKCCASVLVKAKVNKNDGTLTPKSTDELRGIASQEVLTKAWAPKKGPKASDVEFDVVTCVEDYCMTGNCALGASHADDVESDEEVDVAAEEEEKEMIETNKKQVEAEED